MKFFAVLLTFVLVQTFLMADDKQEIKVTTLDQAITLAKENSLDYRKALWSAEKAKQAVPEILKIEDSSLTLSETFSDTPQAQGWNLVTALDVPILEGLSLNGKIDQQGNTQAGISFNPLTHSSERDQKNLTYEKALLSAKQAAGSLETSVPKAYLEKVSLDRKLAAKQAWSDVKESLYKDEKARLDRGTGTLDGVRTALSAWFESRSALSDLQEQSEKALMSLQNLVQGTGFPVSFGTLEIKDLEEFLEKLKKSFTNAPGVTNPNLAVQTLSMEKAAIDLELNHTWLIEPKLSLNASMTRSADGKITYSPSAVLTIGLGDFKTETRTQLEKDSALAQARVDLETASQASTRIQELSKTASTEKATANRRLALEQAQELRNETEYLLKKGGVSETEAQQARLSCQDEENGLFDALKQEIGVWLDLLAP